VKALSGALRSDVANRADRMLIVSNGQHAK
jgi:hypothetical protein